jgi:hypothetical protein
MIHKNALRWSLAAGLVLAAGVALAQVPGAPVPPDQFAALHAMIKPQPGEALWANIPWQTNLAQARQMAVAQDRPLFVWRAGGGLVLGRV